MHFDHALQQERNAQRADAIEDNASAMWGASKASTRASDLRKRR